MISPIGIELGPAIAPQEFEDFDVSLVLERFRAATTKIAIQKDGVLTDIARLTLLDNYGINVPESSDKSRLLVDVSDDGAFGFVYARNKAICGLVAQGAVDMAIVGTDRLIEDGAENEVDVIASFRDKYAWELVLATPANNQVTDISAIRRVASQYPVITRRYFESMGRFDVDVVESVGGTELYPYLDFMNGPVDAVVDLISSGQTMRDHSLVPWTPSIGQVYPVLIQSRRSPSMVSCSL